MPGSSSPSTGFAGVALAEPAAGLPGLFASPAPHPEALARALSRVPPGDLPILLDRIAFHRIDGLAHRALSLLPAGEAHPWLKFTLKRRHQRQAARALAQGLDLAELLDALDRAAVPVAVLRGLRAAEWIYRDPGARLFENHDLLVRPGDLPAAGPVLRRLGYEECAPRSFRRGGTRVDLHVGGPRTRGSFIPFSVASLFAEALPGLVAGAPALLLRPEDDLVLLSLDLIRRSFGRLLEIADLGHFLAAHGRMICWEAVRRRADSARTLRLVQLALASPAAVGVCAPEALHPGALDPVEGFLLRRALELRPVALSGQILLALARPIVAGEETPAVVSFGRRRDVRSAS